MSNQNKNSLSLKEIAAVGTAAATLIGGVALKNIIRADHMESRGTTHLVTETQRGLGQTGHESGTATVRVPVANGTERTP